MTDGAVKGILHILEFALFQVASTVLGLFPLPIVRGAGGRLGEFAYRWLGFRRDITRQNLARAFPEKSNAELESLAVRAFRSVGISLLELLQFSRMTVEDVRASARLNNVDVLRKHLRRGKGVVLLTAHIGNWEMIPPALMVVGGMKIDSLYKPLRNTLIDRTIVERRVKFGPGLISMGMGVREILKALQEGRCILVAADQSAPMESIRMKFFGREVPVFQGPAAFVLKTGAALVTMFSIRQDDGSYLLECSDIPTNDLSPGEEGIRELTQRHLEATENIIRRFPDQWMWMHRRWKHETGAA